MLSHQLLQESCEYYSLFIILYLKIRHFDKQFNFEFIVKISFGSALHLWNISITKAGIQLGFSPPQIIQLGINVPNCTSDGAFLFFSSLVIPPYFFLHLSDFHGLKSVKKLHFFQVVQAFLLSVMKYFIYYFLEWCI